MICSKLQIILLILFRDALMIDTNDTSGYRKERVNGHIVKLNSNKQNTIHCDGEGFRPDQEDCTIYYRCVKANNDKYNTFRFQCPAGTVFDTYRGICNYPQIGVEYYGCKIPSENQQSDNKIKDTYSELPKPILNRDDVGLNNPPPNYNELSEDYQEVPYKHEYPVTPSTVVAYSTERYTQRPSFLVENDHDDNRCTTDGFIGDSNNCKKFYRCVSNLRGGFIRYEFMCNDATIWDDNTQGCNHAWIARNSKCRKDDTYNYINDINLDFGDKNNYDKNLDQKKDNDDFPNNYNQPNIEPIQTTTKKYIQIDSTTRTEKPYNKPTTSAVQIHKFGDKILGYGNSVSNSTTTDSLKEPYFDKYQSEICSQNGFFGYPGDCKKFYRCIESSNGKYIRYEFSCSDGTVWDDHLKTCNFAWAVKECGSFVPLKDEIKVVTTTNINVVSSSVHTSSSRPPKDEFFGQTTPNSQEIVTKPSTLSDIGASVTYDLYQEECNSNGFYGDKNNCQNFYRCIETRRGVFTKLAYKCGEGTLWDPSIEACNHAWAVKNCTVSVVNRQTIADTPVITTVSLIQTTTQANEILEHKIDSQYNQGPNQFAGSTPKDINHFENNFTHNKCTSSGFIGDANDCHKFYRCVDNGSGKFTQYEFTCGENTVWDSSIESCNHAWAVEKCGAVETVQLHPTTHGYGLVSEENISDSKGTTAAADSSYSISTTRTTEVYEENKPYTATGQQSQLTTTTTTTKTPLTSEQIEQVSTSSSNKCTEEGYFGNVEDCKKFYRCIDNGKAGLQMYEYSCGEGTIWDQDLKACNHPQDVEHPSCSSSTDHTWETSSMTSSTYYENPSSKSTTTTTLYTSTPTISSTLQSMGDLLCNAEGFFGDENDCKIFYRCVGDINGRYIKYEFACGEGTIWDQSILACNHPQEVKQYSCSGNNSNYSTPTNNDASTTTELTTSKASFTSTVLPATTMENSSSNIIEPSTTGKPSQQSTSSIDTINPVDENTCSKEGYFGNTEDCGKFYRCVDNGKNSFTKYDFTCGEGTIWDQDILACNHPQDVEHPSCSSNVSSAESTTSAKPTHIPSSSTAKISTSSSSITNTQTTTTISSPTSTSTTPKTSISTNPSSATMNPNDENTCSKEGYFGNTENCGKFYRCVDNGKNSFTKYDFTCGEGTIWDQDILACNHPQDVKHPSCSSNVSSAESTTTEKPTNVPSSSTAKISTSSSSISNTQTTTTISSPTSTSTTPKTSTTTTPSSATINPIDENTCSKEGYFGNTEDCGKFYRCVDNGKNSFTKYDFTCGEGTIWDQDILACNHPQDVKHPSCSSNVSSAESTTTEKPTNVPSSSTAKISTSSSSISNTQTTTTTSSPTSTSTTPKTSTSTTTSSTPSSTSSSSTSSTEGSTMANNENQTSMEEQEKGNFTCTKAGFYPNPNDCKKFYRCVDWYNNGTSFSIFHFDCGEGTIWDPSLDTCNYEDSVYPPRNCNGSSIQTQNDTESTTSGSSSTDTTTTQASTAMTTSGPSTTEESSSTSTTEQSSSTSTTEQSSSTSTTEQIISTSTTEQSSTSSTTEQSSSTQTSTTTEQQTSTTEKTTTQTEASSTEQSTTATSESTTTERSTTPLDQTDKTTAESSTTTQSSSTEQQSTSNTDSSSEPTDSDKTTTEATQQTTESTTNSTTKDKCPEMNDDQYAYVCPSSFRRHPKYCNLFYQCTEDDDSHDLKIALFHCPNNTIYDESKTQCVDENKASKKCDGTLARTHRIKRFSNDYIDPIIVGTDSYACPNVGYFPFERNQDCSQAMLKCQRSKNNNLTGYVFRCPDGYTFWTKSKRCERISRIKDCKRSIYPWNKRHDIPKEVYNVALY
ncbi:serine-rich adhesin for platelets [Pieris brassicae]|uniref:serine-rich adhesin for platelets n=1 Tax=Pieris brassicae TaxID=7116 RepID=UPI001E65EA37|nr:serine-rich adhesin for platelets [Pieris brassicae]